MVTWADTGITFDQSCIYFDGSDKCPKPGLSQYPYDRTQAIRDDKDILDILSMVCNHVNGDIL